MQAAAESTERPALAASDETMEPPAAQLREASPILPKVEPRQSSPASDRSQSPTAPPMATGSGSTLADAMAGGPKPPYTAPSDVVYPEETIPNPHLGSMSEQPNFLNLPAGSLFRPERLPLQMDERVAKGSVWMGVERDSCKAVYFLPPTCKTCSQPGVAQFCDREWPTCTRCKVRKTPCEWGTKWGLLRQRPKRHSKAASASGQTVSPSSAKSTPARPPATTASATSATSAGGRYTAAEKGKARATEDAVPTTLYAASKGVSGRHGAAADDQSEASRTPNLPQAPGSFIPARSIPPSANDPADSSASSTGDASPSAEGRGKRIKKRRRLSMADEIDPTAVPLDSYQRAKKVKRKAPSLPHPPTLAPPNNKSSNDAASAPLSSADTAYFERIKSNTSRPAMASQLSPCPVWANTRRALQAAAEYLRNPVKTAGGSVEIGAGGVARGVILEGDAEGCGTYWGEGPHTGTIVTCLGAARPRRKPQQIKVEGDEGVVDNAKIMNGIHNDPDEDDTEVGKQARTGPSSPGINILPSIISDRPVPTSSANPALQLNGASQRTVPASNFGPQASTHLEAEEVEALLMAQRAKTPVALALSQDYTEVPFKVPRPFVVLGWFWIVDAWPEPFDLWEDGTPRDEPGRPESRDRSNDMQPVRWKFRFEFCTETAQNLPWYAQTGAAGRSSPCLPSSGSNEWTVSGPGISGSTTVRSSSITDGPSRDLPPCASCNFVSSKVYREGHWCLNERCPNYFLRVGVQAVPAVGDNNYRTWSAGGSLARYAIPVADEAGHVSTGPKSNEPADVAPTYRMPPTLLGLNLRAPEPANQYAAEANRTQLGREYWRGWVCGKCGMANERRKWSGWHCEACNRDKTPNRIVYTAQLLRNPIRPSPAFGPRQDNGFASLPFAVTVGASVFDQARIKFMKYTFSVAHGGAEMHHALDARTSPPGMIPHIPSAILDALQKEAPQVGWVPLKRHLMASVSARPAERYPCPFYTLLCGPRTVSPLTSLPTSSNPIPWEQSPTACLDAMDFINFRAGCMFPGQPERFNSLLLAVSPPPSIPAYQPKITVHPGEHLGLLVLGSEATVKIRRNGKGKSGELIMQHGDVFCVRSGVEMMELQIKMDGFGFFCVARQVYRATNEPGEGAITDTRHPIHHRAGKAAQRGNAETAEETELVSADASLQKLDNLPPPVPTKYLDAPLLDLYLGPRPLDPSQPLRLQPATRTLPAGTIPAGQPGQPSEPSEPSSNAAVWDSAVAGPSRPSGAAMDVAHPDSDGEHLSAAAAESTGVEILPTGSPPPPSILYPEIPPSPTAQPGEIAAEPKSRKSGKTDSSGTGGAGRTGSGKGKGKRMSEVAGTPVSMSMPIGTPGAGTPGSTGAEGKRKKKRKSMASGVEPALGEEGDGDGDEVGTPLGEGASAASPHTGTSGSHGGKQKRSHKKKRESAELPTWNKADAGVMLTGGATM